MKNGKTQPELTKPKSFDFSNEGEYSDAPGALSDLSQSEFGDLNNFDYSLLIGYSNEIPHTI